MAVTEPAVLVQNFAGQLQTAVVLQMETKALREEVATLREWQAEAVRLRAENQALRNLLTMRAAHEVTSAAGKVLADQGANFGQSVLVAVPAEFPLRRGLVAMTDVGMVGRTVEISQGAGLARVLLLSDPASRLPVMLEGSRIRAILAGQGTHELLLEHLPSGNMPQVGEKIVSAGSDGVLPSDLPLAQVTRIDGDRVYAAPLAPLDRIEWLRLVDFGTIATLNKPNFQSSGF
jgi:rod shape-determining protein MreC